MKFTKLTVSVGVLLCAIALSGCGQKPDDGIPTANQNNTNPSGAPISEDPQERARQFAQCMRDQGIDMPDPEFSEDGGMSIQIGPGEDTGGEGPSNDSGPVQGAVPQGDQAKMKAAMEACQKYLPQGGEMGKPDPEMEAKMREFAKCMRENGVENFPDPQEGGGIIIQGGPGSENGIDPNDPAFKEAQKKCEQYMPKPKEATAS